MNYLMQFIKEQKGKVVLTLLFLLGQVVGTLLIPYLIARMVDEAILSGEIQTMYQIGMYMLAVLIGTTLIAVLGSYYCADLAAEFGYQMRANIVRKSQEVALYDFDSIGVSSMITRTTSDITNIQQTLGLVLQLIVPAPLMISTSIVMTAFTNVRLSVVLIGTVVVFLWISFIVLKKSTVLSHRVQKKFDRINQIVRESITGIRVIRAFGNERYEEERAEVAYQSYANDMIQLNKMFAILNPIIWFMIGGSIAVIVWFGGVFSIQGSIEIGEITAVTEYSIITLSYLVLATTTSVTLPKMKSCLDRLEEVLALPVAMELKQEGKHEDFTGDIVLAFENVSFCYKGAEEPVIKEISFSCKKGQTTAIIGSTGSGKSTIANLIVRLHDVSEGTIRFHGKDIRTMDPKTLRGGIGYVPQKAFLFSGSIEDNLRMGNENATQEETIRALEVSQSKSFVEALPEGLKTEVVQGGGNFSGGQRQRLSIARALMRTASLYIFDDSFSALDVKTDYALRSALKKQMKDATSLIIAQRVSTIMDADQILVLEEGTVVGVGTHKELMQHCPIYQAIAKSQMGPQED